MPTTYNGCGTRYCGKKNVQSRPGPCASCNRAVTLSSYDTRLWVVILFIPVIPLKRMRIIDYCPACTRHYAMEAQKWETTKQLEVSGALDRFRTDPTAESGIAVHQQLLNFHLLEQAGAFRKTLDEKFSDNAKVHVYLGASLTHVGSLDEAEGHYLKAYAIRPDLPDVRAGVALLHLRHGNLDEARPLLDFLEKPGASQLYSLEPLNVLAKAYQGVNRHEEALCLFGVLQREMPNLTELPWFRKHVAQSEKALGHKESRLPKLRFSLKRLFGLGGPSAARTFAILGVVAALLALGFIVSRVFPISFTPIFPKN